jgi:hypothetical protein
MIIILSPYYWFKYLLFIDLAQTIICIVLLYPVYGMGHIYLFIYLYINPFTMNSIPIYLLFITIYLWTVTLDDLPDRKYYYQYGSNGHKSELW